MNTTTSVPIASAGTMSITSYSSRDFLNHLSDLHTYATLLNKQAEGIGFMMFLEMKDEFRRVHQNT